MLALFGGTQSEGPFLMGLNNVQRGRVPLLVGWLRVCESRNGEQEVLWTRSHALDESFQWSCMLQTSCNMAEGESSLLIWKLKVKMIFQSWSTFEYPRYLSCSTYYMHIYAKGYTDKPQFAVVYSGFLWIITAWESVSIFFLPFVGLFFFFSYI